MRRPLPRRRRRPVAGSWSSRTTGPRAGSVTPCWACSPTPPGARGSSSWRSPTCRDPASRPSCWPTAGSTPITSPRRRGGSSSSARSWLAPPPPEPADREPRAREPCLRAALGLAVADCEPSSGPRLTRRGGESSDRCPWVPSVFRAGNLRLLVALAAVRAFRGGGPAAYRAGPASWENSQGGARLGLPSSAGPGPVLAPVRVQLLGALLADSTDALRVLETSHPPTIYIPPADVKGELLVAGDARGTWCEFKGAAQYVDALIDGMRVPAVGWTYREPSPGYHALTDHIAFYPGRVDDAWLDDERIEAQSSDFYGGWITGDLVGPFKGPPGTLGWGSPQV